jgi:integration host factor subunit alpha
MARLKTDGLNRISIQNTGKGWKMTLTKKDMVDAVQDELGLPGKRCFDIVETLLEILKRTMEEGESVLIRGFGKFYVNEKKERRGRNPATGEVMMLEPRRVVRFKCSQKLRNRINGLQETGDKN